MKNNFLLCLLIIGLASFFSCSNEFELNAPAKEIPIVYGLLSRADDVHYIRVEKAFIDEQTSALELAQQPDELYFDNEITVELVKESDGQSYILERVDVSQLGLEREAGIFATNPNILYKIDAVDLNLAEDEVYRINVRKADDTILTTATTPVVSDLRLNRPVPGDQKLPLRILEDDEITIIWGADETASLFDATMVIHYEEFAANDPNSLVQKTVEWTLGESIEAIDGPNRVEPEGIEFYRFLSTAIEENAAVLRVLRTIDIRIDAGGVELFNYINVGSANTGITSAQVIPNYTNLSTGLGIFASRNQFIEKGFVIDSQTKELLKNGDLTKDLNFR